MVGKDYTCNLLFGKHKVKSQIIPKKYTMTWDDVTKDETGTYLGLRKLKRREELRECNMCPCVFIAEKKVKRIIRCINCRRDKGNRKRLYKKNGIKSC